MTASDCGGGTSPGGSTTVTTRQISLGEFFNASDDADELDETPQPQIDPTVDLNTVVCIGKSGIKYHSIRHITPDGTVVSMCPHHHEYTITLLEAAGLRCQPCEMCGPIDWRADSGKNHRDLGNGTNDVEYGSITDLWPDETGGSGQ